MGAWNDFMWPLIVLTDEAMYTLPVALANLLGEHVQDTELMMAGSVEPSCSRACELVRRRALRGNPEGPRSGTEMVRGGHSRSPFCCPRNDPCWSSERDLVSVRGQNPRQLDPERV